MPYAIDTIISASHLITMESEDAVLHDAAIAIDEGRILAVDSKAAIDYRYVANEYHHFDHHLVMPGMINTHGHCPMIPYRGKLPGNVPFERVVFDYMLPLEADFCARKDFVYLSTTWALAELAAGGVTTTAEMYYFVEDMAKAFRERNMRGILGETVMTGGTHHFSDPKDFFYHMSRIAERSDDLVTFAIAPHAPYTCDDPDLLQSVALCMVLNIPFLMHANETLEEVNNLYYRFRRGCQDAPLVDLHKKGILNHGKITLAHCNYLSPAEYTVIKNQGIGVAHNPVCNAGIGLQTANLWALQSHGIPVGLATDGPMTNDRLDLLSQLKPAQLLHRMRHGTSEMFSTYNLVRMITCDAARALHRDDIGMLAPGRWADIAVLDVGDPACANYLRMNNPFAYLVNYAAAGDVAATFVAGKLTVPVDLEKTIEELQPHLDAIAGWKPKQEGRGHGTNA